MKMDAKLVYQALLNYLTLCFNRKLAETYPLEQCWQDMTRMDPHIYTTAIYQATD